VLTEFWWAYLSGRAVQLIAFDHLPDYSTAFDSPCINWSVTEATYPRKYWYHLRVPYDQPHAPDPADKVDPAVFRGFDYVNDQQWIYRLATETDLRVNPDGIHDVPYVFASGNRGATAALWQSRYHAKELKAIVRRYSCVAAAFNFLFAPNAATQALLRPFIEAMRPVSGTPPIFWVGIHLRHSDKEVFVEGADKFDVDGEGGGGNMHPHMDYFNCAATVGKALAPRGSIVRWLLISDSLSVRRSAVRRFGDLILTDNETSAVHVDCRQVGPAHPCDSARQAYAMQLAARDLLLFSRAHAHVLSENSGFGRLGAFLSEGKGSHIAFGMQGAACTLRSRTDPIVIYEWSGVRR
jgi:hypothetical protein